MTGIGEKVPSSSGGRAGTPRSVGVRLEQRVEIETPEQVVFGYTVAGIGSRAAAALLDHLLLALITLILWVSFAFLATSLPVVVTMFLAYGIYFGFTEGVEKAWVADLAPAALRGTAFGIYNAALGLGGLAASLIFGAIWTRVSPQAAFLTGAALALAASVLLYLAFSDAQNSGHQR